MFYALRVMAYVTSSTMPRISAPDHDISLPVEEKLILELELWVLCAEWLDIFQGCKCC